MCMCMDLDSIRLHKTAARVWRAGAALHVFMWCMHAFFCFLSKWSWLRAYGFGGSTKIDVVRARVHSTICNVACSSGHAGRTCTPLLIQLYVLLATGWVGRCFMKSISAYEPFGRVFVNYYSRVGHIRVARAGFEHGIDVHDAPSACPAAGWLLWCAASRGAAAARAVGGHGRALRRVPAAILPPHTVQVGRARANGRGMIGV